MGGIQNVTSNVGVSNRIWREARVCKTILSFLEGLKLFLKILSVQLQSIDKICCVWWSAILYAPCWRIVPRRCFPIFLLIFIWVSLRAIANPAWLRSARERCIIPFLKDVLSWTGQSYCSDSSSALKTHQFYVRYIWNHWSRIRIPQYSNRITHLRTRITRLWILSLIGPAYLSALSSWAPRHWYATSAVYRMVLHIGIGV